jgi:dienelactone hydrolase
VVLSDADSTPESVSIPSLALIPHRQFARRLAENGYRVLVPTLINRESKWSALPGGRKTDQPHREFIYRAAYEMGRHIIGYEVQQTLAAVDYFNQRYEDMPIGVFGYGEGGLIALYSAALDDRIDSVVVSGYFKPREDVWREPIYRNIWSLLRSFGDAELLSMIAPRTAIVEACAHPEVRTPPHDNKGGRQAAPGEITTPSLEDVRAEFKRARSLVPDANASLYLAESNDGRGDPGSEACMRTFIQSLGIAPHPLPEAWDQGRRESNADQDPVEVGFVLPDERQKRMFDQWNEFTQRLVRQSPQTRDEFQTRFNACTSSKAPEEMYRRYLSTEVLGELPALSASPNTKSRQVYNEPTWRGYEVMLDVLPDVFAYGILLVPKDIKPDERRPVVICQHGLEGRAADTIVEQGQPFNYYQAFARRLVERGFIVYSPQNPYIGWDRFRVLNRKANPLELSLWSFIVRQHEQTLNWLEALPFVDGKRVAFYGLSYGGKTAMRIPAVLHGRYAAVICSGDFNEWCWKMTSLTAPFSYMFVHEYEMYTFDMGNTFNYAELAGLIAPTPFMVERGHRDGVSIDEWVAYEYAKVRRHYVKLGIADRTEIEYFNGPHQIHGVGTLRFLHKHLNWPE